MITFIEWLELNDAAKYYFNQQTYDKWIVELVNTTINRIFTQLENNPDHWMSYNLPYWKKNRSELVNRLEPMTQSVFDNNPGIHYNELMGYMRYAVQQIFQKEPYTRRHIAHAASLGKHPQEIEKRSRGRQLGYKPS